jgi:predicted metal-binding membrane protein
VNRNGRPGALSCTRLPILIGIDHGYRIGCGWALILLMS